MASNVVITFDSIPAVDETLLVTIDLGGGDSLLCIEKFRIQRLTSKQTTIGGTVVVQAEKYTEAWNLDWISQGGINSLKAIHTLATGIVTIILKNDDWQITSVTGTAVTGGAVSFVINNDPVEDVKSAVVSGWTLHASPCINVYADVDVTGGNDIYDVYLDGVLIQSAQSTPLQILTTRGQRHLLLIIDTLVEIIAKIQLVSPPKILESQITLTIEVFAGGTTVTVDPLTILSSLRPLEYKLEGGSYSSSNVFAGLSAATYTLYVKDVFGCETTKEFVLDGLTEVSSTIFSLSDINPIRYAKVETGKKNHKNTLSCHEVRQLRYPYFHRYIEADSPVTQFKTNAAYINCYTIDGALNQIPIVPVQMTENIGLEAKTTSTYFDLGSGRSAIYFGVVDVLNVLTDAVEDTIDFGFSLPEWADTIGKEVNIEGLGDVTIDNVGYSDFYDSFIIEFDIAHTGSPVTKKLYSQYNIQPYEVYEFATVMATHPDLFNIVLEVGTDSDNISHCLISEKMKKVVDYDNLYQIVYFDSANKGGMVYQTGVQHIMRLEGIVDYLGEQETEGYDGDTDYFVTDNLVYDSQTFTFFRLSGEMAAKLRLVVTHETLIINGLAYRLSEAPEITTNKNNNFKTFSVNLKLSGDLLLTNDQEIISGTAEADTVAAALAASQGKSLLLWTKING